MNRFLGVEIFVAPDQPRYVLPDEVVPGEVPWPPGFKEQLDAWALASFGTHNQLEDGEVYTFHSPDRPQTMHMNPRTYAALKEAVGRRAP